MSNEQWGQWGPGARASAVDGFRIRIARSVAGGNDHRLFQRGQTVTHFVEGGVAQRFHPLAGGDFPDLHGAGPSDDRFADLVGNRHGLDDGQSAGITGVIATLAPPAAVEGDAVEEVRCDVQVGVHRRRVGEWLFAVGTDSAHEALGASEDDRGRDEERSDAHVVESGHGAGGVVAVHGAEDLVAGERSLDGDLGGLRIANLANHDDVRVLAQNGAQGVAEGEADLLFHGHLVDPGELEFDGIFDGDDVVFGVVQLVESGIERGGFAGAGGPGDEQQAVRSVDRGAEPAIGIGVQPDLLDARGEVAFVEHAQDDLLAVHGGQEGNAEVEIASADFDPHATVLGQSPFGDVQAAHDLQARGEGDLQILRRRHLVHQRAIDAVAQADHFLEGLDVNVAGAFLDGLDEDEVGQLDDRRLFGGGGQLVEVDLLGDFLDRLQSVGFGGDLGLLGGIVDDLLHAARFAGVEVVQLVEDGFLGSDHGRDVHFADAPDVVDGQHVERVGHGQEKFVFQAGDGNDFVIVADFAREQIGDLGRDAATTEVDRRDVEDAAHGNGHVGLGHEPLVDDHLEEAGAFLFLLFEQFFDLLGEEQAILHQRIGDAFSKGFYGSHDPGRFSE